MNYESLFIPNKHYLTTRFRTRGYGKRRVYEGNKQLTKFVKRQQKDTDLYITKYSDCKLVNCVILDFDSEEDKNLALNDVELLREYLNSKGLNSVIISSGNKGYHLYIQIPSTLFADSDAQKLNFPATGYDLRFKYYVNNLINHKEFAFNTLDAINLNAGLNGNIRIIGSRHPISKKKCRIFEGEFLDYQEPNDYHLQSLLTAWKQAEIKEKEFEEQRINREKIGKIYGDNEDPIQNNDLRVIMPQIFGGDVKQYQKGYIYMQCPFHNDNNPSCLVTKEFYSCSGCGAKGNWFTLRDMGYVDFKYTYPDFDVNELLMNHIYSNRKIEVVNGEKGGKR